MDLWTSMLMFGMHFECTYRWIRLMHLPFSSSEFLLIFFFNFSSLNQIFRQKICSVRFKSQRFFFSFNVLRFSSCLLFGAVMRCNQIIYLVVCHLGLPGLAKRQNNRHIKITIQWRICLFLVSFCFYLHEVKNCPIFSHAMVFTKLKILEEKKTKQEE